MDLYVLIENGSNADITSDRFGSKGQIVVKDKYDLYRLLTPRPGQYGYSPDEPRPFGLNADRVKKL